MVTLTINKESKYSDIKLYYDRLNRMKDEDAEVDLIIPVELNLYYIGIIPAIFQFIVSWIRYPKSGKLLVDIPKEYDETIVQSEFLFPVLALVWDQKPITDILKKKNLRIDLKGPMNKAFLSMKKFQIINNKTKKLILFNSDHLARRNGILKCFEINNEFIANYTILEKHLEESIKEEVLGYSSAIKNEYGKISTPINKIIYELMKNTFMWAKEDEQNGALDPGVRGFSLKFVKKRRDSLIDDFSDHKGLSEYFKSNRLKENNTGELYFLEISVFDTGIGMINKWKSQNIEESETDLNILKKCLTKHMTSVKGLKKEDHGIGLDRMLQVLDSKGFIRIRTNALAVYRDLIANPYQQLAKYEKMSLHDWDTHSSINIDSKANASGTVISIIYPLAINE